MRIYEEDFVYKVKSLAVKENVRYVVFNDKNLDILGTARTIAQIKKMAIKYLENYEDAVIMYYDDDREAVFFLKGENNNA